MADTDGEPAKLGAVQQLSASPDRKGRETAMPGSRGQMELSFVVVNPSLRTCAERTCAERGERASENRVDTLSFRLRPLSEQPQGKTAREKR